MERLELKIIIRKFNFIFKLIIWTVMKNMNSFYQEISAIFVKYVIGNISNSLKFVIDLYSCHCIVFEVSFLTINTLNGHFIKYTCSIAW